MAARPTFDDLPNELLTDILSWLPWRQQLVARRVCSRWQVAADSLRRELTIGKSPSEAEINTESLLSLLKDMPALQRLSISGTTFDRRALERLCASCPQLQEIKWENKFMDRGLPMRGAVHTLLRLLPHLRSVRLHNTDEGYSMRRRYDPGLLQHCPQMRELHLSRMPVCSTELAAVLAACPRLERLAVVSSYANLRGDWLPEVRRCPQLRELHVSLMAINSEELVAVLAACPHLERLAVVCPALDAHWLPELRRCRQLLPRLTHLDISGTEIRGDTVGRLPALLPGLRDLRLCSYRNLTDTTLEKFLPRLTSLQVLDVRDTGVYLTDRVISQLSALPLKALACHYPLDPAVSLRRQSRHSYRLHQLMSRCPSLTVICTGHGEMFSLISRLIRDPVLQHREVTLITERAPGTSRPAGRAPRLPRNIRLLVEASGRKDRSGVSQLSSPLWERYSGWRPFWAL